MSPRGIVPTQDYVLRARAIEEQRKRSGQWGGSVRAHTEYQKRPLDWIVEKLGVPEETIRWSKLPEYKGHVWDGDPDPLVKVLEGLAEGQDVGCESGTGTGKTYLAACVMLWFLACFENSLVISAAPKQDQLLLNMWKETGRLYNRFQKQFPESKFLTGKLRMKSGEGEKEIWTATAFVAGVGADEEAATRAQGFHGESMLWITEETPGMAVPMMNTIENTRTGAFNPQLSLGNPDHRNDPLHTFCLKPWVTHVRISALDHPNVVTGRTVVPGAVSRQSIEKRKVSYGVDSRLYQSRVRGISPAESEDSLIKWAWCQAAHAKYNDESLRGLPALGVDVANSENGDRGSIARFEGACLTEVESFPCPNASELGTRVVMEARSRGIGPRNVGADSVGVGAATINKGKELNFKMRALNGGERAVPRMDIDLLWSTERQEFERVKPAGPAVVPEEQFLNLRSQMWWTMREDLRLMRIALPDDEELWHDLTTPQYTTKNGKIVVEPKEEIRKRLGRSPDKGDAAVYANWVRERKPSRQPLPNIDELAAANPHIDYGLERLSHAHDKAMYAKKRQMKRAVRRMTKRR